MCSNLTEIKNERLKCLCLWTLSANCNKQKKFIGISGDWKLHRRVLII